ncbi:hypothetical protein BDA96_03G115200 [Sorghum bicolor]|uniref:SnoaL-like domain-containing protein n=2 Tax=Sorghum bicolor TaxID=4558 RepID=A0A921RAQ8_SORBI|nr:hypothetical protein BDA96_03G115200 [Sorghum bicolor]KXG32165.1 hypothetical protein SORBI_3003G110700 [Sorghum bicolor]
MPLQHGPRLRMAAASGAARRPRSRLPGRPTSLPCGGSRTRTTALVLVAATTREGAKTTAAVATATAADVVRAFYDGVNRRDLAAVEPLIAEGCVYEDLVFPRPFVGRERIIGFFGEFMGTISPDLQFVIDDISADDSAAVGVTWHLEWRGKPFPFSRGCSFYRLLAGSESESEQQPLQIVYGRDCVEPAAKPGDLALVRRTRA